MANLTAGLSLTVSLGFSLANCAESMTAAWLLVRFLGTPLTMITLRDVMGLTGLAVIASNAGTACLGAALSIALANPCYQHEYKVFKRYPLPSYFHPRIEHG